MYWIRAVLALLLISGAGLGLAADPVKPGDKAVDFELKNHNGQPVKLSELMDKTIVLEWTNPRCPFVVRHYEKGTMVGLYEKYKDKGVVWFAVNSSHYGDGEANKEWAKEYKVPFAILDDSSGEVGRQYGAQTTPHMMIIHEGVVVYSGAIDDDPRGQSSLTENYVDVLLGKISAGEDVKPQSNKPYGCSVKYK